MSVLEQPFLVDFLIPLLGKTAFSWLCTNKKNLYMTLLGLQQLWINDSLVKTYSMAKKKQCRIGREHHLELHWTNSQLSYWYRILTRLDQLELNTLPFSKKRKVHQLFDKQIEIGSWFDIEDKAYIWHSCVVVNAFYIQCQFEDCQNYASCVNPSTNYVTYCSKHNFLRGKDYFKQKCRKCYKKTSTHGCSYQYFPTLCKECCRKEQNYISYIDMTSKKWEHVRDTMNELQIMIRFNGWSEKMNEIHSYRNFIDKTTTFGVRSFNFHSSIRPLQYCILHTLSELKHATSELDTFSKIDMKYQSESIDLKKRCQVKIIKCVYQNHVEIFQENIITCPKTFLIPKSCILPLTDMTSMIVLCKYIVPLEDLFHNNNYFYGTSDILIFQNLYKLFIKKRKHLPFKREWRRLKKNGISSAIDV